MKNLTLQKIKMLFKKEQEPSENRELSLEQLYKKRRKTEKKVENIRETLFFSMYFFGLFAAIAFFGWGLVSVIELSTYVIGYKSPLIAGLSGGIYIFIFVTVVFYLMGKK